MAQPCYYTIYPLYSRVWGCFVNTNWEVLEINIGEGVKNMFFLYLNNIWIWDYKMLVSAAKIGTNINEIVWWGSWCAYNVIVQVIEDHTAIAVRCSCGGYHMSTIMATIADAHHNLNPLWQLFSYRLSLENHSLGPSNPRPFL